MTAVARLIDLSRRARSRLRALWRADVTYRLDGSLAARGRVTRFTRRAGFLALSRAEWEDDGLDVHRR